MSADDRGTGPVGLPIGEATRRLLRARGLEATVTLGDVLLAWDDIVGPQVSAHAQPCALHASVLSVEVDEPAWATQIQFLSGGILSGLSERLGARAPATLNLRVARPGSGRSRSHN
jgi:predicted nucleic acid-binding Zn ribbon protein